MRVGSGSGEVDLTVRLKSIDISTQPLSICTMFSQNPVPRSLCMLPPQRPPMSVECQAGVVVAVGLSLRTQAAATYGAARLARRTDSRIEPVQ
ncbi:unnamed protein product [Arctogadus glacialis]